MITFFKKNYLFEQIPDDVLKAISEKFTITQYHLGEPIISKNDKLKNIFIIKSGRVRLVDEVERSVNLVTLKSGDCFGEESFFYNKTHPFSARSADETEIYIIPFEEIEALINLFPEIREKIQERYDFLKKVSFLKSSQIFAEIKAIEAEKIFPEIKLEKINKGDIIYNENDESTNAFIIYYGKVRIVKSSHSNRLLYIAKPGEIIGEASLLSTEPRTETMVADEDSEIFIITKEIYDRFLNKYPKITEYLNSLIDTRKIQYETLLSTTEKKQVTGKSDIILKKIKYGKGLKSKNVYLAETSDPFLSGIACLMMINAYYHKSSNQNKLIERQRLINQPDTLSTVSRKIENDGYITRLLISCPNKIYNSIFPILIEWENKELCVIYSINREYALLGNPLRGILKIPLKEFFEKWDRQVLAIDYIPEFSGAGKEIKKIFKRFIPLFRPYKNILISIGIISLFVQLMTIVLPIFQGVIIDKVFIFGDFSLLILMLIGMLFVTAFQLLGNIIRQYLIAHAIRKVTASLEFRFLKHIFLLPQKIFLKWQVGDFTTRFNENEKILQLVSQNVFKVIIDSSTIIIYLIMLLGINGTLTGYSLIFVFGYAALIIFASPKLRANEIAVFERLRDSESFLIETVGNIGTIKSMAAEKIFYENGIMKFIEQKKIAFKTAKFSYIISLISNVLNQSSLILILGLGSKMALEGKITTGELITFNATLGLLLAPLNSLITMWDEIQQIRVSFDRLNDVLNLKTEPINNMIITEPLTGKLKIEGVTFKYEGAEKNALEEINLEILPGQKIALVGRSGSGKSTFVNLLNKLLEPTTGKIYYDSRDISEVDPPSLRNQIGFVEQQPYLFSGTIKENILISTTKNISYNEMVSIAKMAGVEDFVDNLPMGYDTQIGERGMTLSGGEKQRLVIARALMKDPRILILDEATSALDTESERIIQNNLDMIMKGRTTIVIAHRLSTIKNADKIIVIDQGKIVETGRHEELVELGGLYYYLNQKSRID